MLSFSLSAFAGSFDVYTYRNVNSVTESFLLSFLSFSCVDIEFFDFDNTYVGEEFDKAARYNLVARFANYIEETDPSLISEIVSFSQHSGVTSSFNSSSYVWEGRLKYCRSIVSKLLGHFFSFIMPYWVSNGSDVGYYALVPLNLSIGEADYSGCWSYVEFNYDGVHVHPEIWYQSFVVPVQDYLDSFSVGDNFSRANMPYFWDYSRYGTGTKYPGEATVTRVNYLDYIERYIENYNNSSGSDSSDDSVDLPVFDYDNLDPELLEFIYDFYRPFFLALLSTYDIDFCRADFDFNDFDNEPSRLKAYMLPIIDDLFNKVMGNSYSYYISTYYPNMKEDFISICLNEKDLFYSSPVYAFYPFSDYDGGCSRRFFLGFFELFCSEFLNSRYFAKTDGLSIPQDQLHFGNSKLLLMFSLPVIDVPDDVRGTYSFWKDYYYNDFVEFCVLCNHSIVPVPVYKDLDFYFDSWLFDGDSFYYPYLDVFDFSAQRLLFFDGCNIKHLLEEIITFDSLADYDLLSYISGFFNNALSCFSFLSECFSFVPSEVSICFFGGFVIILIFATIKILL